jgi:hypothetical protein
MVVLFFSGKKAGNNASNRYANSISLLNAAREAVLRFFTTYCEHQAPVNISLVHLRARSRAN